MDDGDFQSSEEHTIENEGIGSYEYWGFKGFDAGHNYVIGTVDLIFEVENPDEELLEEFCGLTSEISEICEFYGEEPEIQNISYEIRYDNKKTYVYISVEYSAIPPTR